MILARNVVANSLGQLIQAGVQLLTVPVYVRLMGTESYGLVGFMAALQTWMAVMDLSLPGSLARELAGARDLAARREAAQRLRLLELVMAGIGLAAFAGIALLARPLASGWLDIRQLEGGNAVSCILLGAASIGLRYVSGLYRSALWGMERMVAINLVLVGSSILRALVTIGLLLWVSPGPVLYFSCLALFSLMEVPVFGGLLYRRLEMAGLGLFHGGAKLKGYARLASGLTVLAGIWLLLSQTDRFFLSHALELARFGEFAVAMSLAASIPLLCGPVSQALLPRLSSHVAAGDMEGFRRGYSAGTRIITAAGTGLAMLLSLHPAATVFAWTGSTGMGRALAAYLPTYAWGNMVAGVLGMVFMASFALGRLRLHVAGSLGLAAVLVPALWWTAGRWGAVGTGWAWLAGNLVYLLACVPLVHRRALPGFNARWILRDLLPVAAVCALPFLLLELIGMPERRIAVALTLCACTLLSIASGLLLAWRLGLRDRAHSQ